MLAVFVHRSFGEEMAVGGEEKIEGFLGGVFEYVSEVFSHERVAAFEAEDDDA